MVTKQKTKILPLPLANPPPEKNARGAKGGPSEIPPPRPFGGPQKFKKPWGGGKETAAEMGPTILGNLTVPFGPPGKRF